MSSSSESEAENARNTDGRRGGGARADDRGGEELATKVLSIQSKRFYLDVKQNDRGRFIKFAEVAGGGKKSRIFMSMHTSNQFKDMLTKFMDFLNGLRKEGGEGGLLHSESLSNDKRRYFLDLRENNRGRFLRITQSCLLSGTRFSIAIPAQGIEELRDALTDLIEEYGEGYLDEPPQVELPEARSFRSDNKNFYFDPGHSDRGDYIKISEVKPSLGVRSSITISARALPQFSEILSDLQAKLAELRPDQQQTNQQQNANEGGKSS
ncbi:purA ssDNA and RNA-binding protein domain-containing protein [Ditylenchus destructor]|uniref:PurA ssDNA and RNA-binding protein domain-containing protein n=1 Tax=Ditylenchus destructor TaxID=166010 RepID=A0AAD4R1J7_9BILA|nr:purA ssDNA and RNA-binding protein domain-containing protein [Ditylenchus destructor]